MHLAADGDAIVGGAGAFQFDLTVPGGSVRTAGVTVVGVLPSHRRRGILRELMRAQLDDVHARGEPLAALWASEASIYRRYGYGLAALCGDMRHPANALRLRPAGRADGGGAHRGSRGGAELCARRSTTARARRRRACSRARRTWWDSRVLDDPEWRRAGGGELAVARARGRRSAAGLRALPAELRLRRRGPDGHGRRARGDRRDARGARSRSGGTSSTSTGWRRSRPSSCRSTIRSCSSPRSRVACASGSATAIFLRLVDVGAALAGRSFATDDDLVFEVADTFCPWNDARFTVRGQKSMEEPDLRLPVDTLASATWRIHLPPARAGRPRGGGFRGRARPRRCALPRGARALVPRDLLSFC